MKRLFVLFLSGTALFIAGICYGIDMENRIIVGTGGSSYAHGGTELIINRLGFVGGTVGYKNSGDISLYSMEMKTGVSPIPYARLNIIGGLDIAGSTYSPYGGAGVGLRFGWLFADIGGVYSPAGASTEISDHISPHIQLGLSVNVIQTGKNIANLLGGRGTGLASADTKKESPPSPPRSDIDKKIPQGSSQMSGNAVAIVIGNRDYHNNIPDVEFAINDARTFTNYLENTFGLPKEDIWYAENLTKANFEVYFGSKGNYKRSRLYRNLVVGQKDLIVYYSGHGAPSTAGADKGKGFLVPVDGDVMSIDITGYGIDTMLENIQDMKDEGIIGNVWIVFDSCFSGDSGGGKLITDISPVALKIENPLMKVDDSLLMFSSSGSQVSSWYREKGHGLFTYFLLKGLGGDADNNQDKVITVDEMNIYLKDMVPKWALNQTAQEQMPQVLTQDPDRVLVTLN